MLAAACVPGVNRPDEHKAGWHDDFLRPSQRRHELRLQSDWRGKPYKDLMEAYGEPLSEWNIPGNRSPETFAVVLDAGGTTSDCIDTFTLRKVEDSREWVVANYFCR